jgi:hypothetical protein
MHILRNGGSAPTRYVLVSTGGWYLCMQRKVQLAARFTSQADAIEVAKALTGRGENGRWEVMPEPPVHADPRDPGRVIA